MELVDTHCHIHFPDYELDPDEVRADAQNDGVTRLICVGCTLTDSQAAIEYAEKHANVWASIGLHPHEAGVYIHDHEKLQIFRSLASKPNVIAVGETGLDYYYEHSTKEDQKKLLRFQLDLALQHKMPLIFHVRDAFEDFWPIFDEYQGLTGVVHSFTATSREVEQIVSRGLYIGLNGITTFTKNPEQLEATRAIPLEHLLLETDAPFLTPVPFRGTICQPKHVRVTAEFLGSLRGESLETLAAATTSNAKRLFKI
jgi:TatD DNase family protein